MDETVAYYEAQAVAFFDQTADVDLSSLQDRFLAELAQGSLILDAGCGSGRDAKAFLKRGYRVEAFDASPSLARLASLHAGLTVKVRRFEDITQLHCYDGIWACASLLHVPLAKIPTTLQRLWNALKPGGAFYISFKHGEGERTHEGRHFTDADEDSLSAWFSNLQDVGKIECWRTRDHRPGRSDVWVNALIRKRAPLASQLITGENDPFLPHLTHAIAAASDAAIAVSFIKTTGLRLLMPDLQGMLARETASGASRVRVVTSDYLDITDPEALRLLMLLQGQGAQVRVFEAGKTSFHLKAYLFSGHDEALGLVGTGFIGSSNISRQALQTGIEWNYRLDYPGHNGFLEAQARFEELFRDPRAVPLTDAWIDRYEERRLPPPRSIVPGDQENDPPPHPTSVQEQALAALDQTRRDGFRRGLVVLATGLGKTWLAAFDAVQAGARRVLFVAHREEILNQAASTFLRIRPKGRVSLYKGQPRDTETDILCASVQTLSRASHLERFSPQHFDYIILDEFHHAAAGTYRRLLNYFAPRFLLGLTATPNRSDSSYILSLCDDNLVFSYGLFKGIVAGLLVPFHYYGIHDEAVDYTEIPWRNGRFDPEQLSNKLATLARARHALSEWRLHRQSKTMAFCASIAHAEFMAAQFGREGVPCAAVYGGSQMSRGEALESLQDGRLEVIFTVDLFNEGVDLPAIDTVMLLRPTESKILFLQQLGRGLRRSEGKDKLLVLDFIGNHKCFLHKPQALFEAGSTYKQLAAFARQVEEGRLELPPGCYANYDLKLIEFLKALDTDGTQKEYEALKDVLDRRPSVSEFYRAGGNLAALRSQYGSWFEFVQAMGDLTDEEQSTLEVQRSFLNEVERARMTKCFKMILLEAMLELDGWQEPPTTKQLAERSWLVLQRRRSLLQDLPEDLRYSSNERGPMWHRYWMENPINAWVGGNMKGPVTTQFRIENGEFRAVTTVSPDLSNCFANMVQELVDHRLAEYEARLSKQGSAAHASPVVVTMPDVLERPKLPYFPNLKIACGHFKSGSADAEEFRAIGLGHQRLDPQRHFIARASGNSMNGGKSPIRDGDYLLLEHLTPTNAGSISGSVIVIERDGAANDENQYLLRTVMKGADGQYLLRANNPDYPDMPINEEMRTVARLRAVLDPLEVSLGQAVAREEIPPLFGHVFNPGNWNSGHVVLADKRAHVLLVTLNKQGKAQDHRYVDHWIDSTTFHWQSQNATSPSSKKGREIIEHRRLGIDIHLFVREHKLSQGLGAPFVYHGKVRYLRHEGTNPMSVVFQVLPSTTGQ